MKRLIATAVAAVAFAVTVPVALAQTSSGSDTSPPVTAPRGIETGSGMMYGQGQGQTPTQVGTGPGMMYGQGQGTYGSGMMSGYGVGWMGGYGGIWVVILLIVVVGAVTWIVTQKRK